MEKKKRKKLLCVYYPQGSWYLSFFGSIALYGLKNWSISANMIRVWLNLYNVELSPKRYWRWWRCWRRRRFVCLSLHCHHQNQFCVKMCSSISHFNVSLIVRTKSQDSIHKPQLFERKRRAEAESNRGPSAYQPNALLLGQTGCLPA